jgi:hypothetical protein
VKYKQYVYMQAYTTCICFPGRQLEICVMIMCIGHLIDAYTWVAAPSYACFFHQFGRDDFVLISLILFSTVELLLAY